MLCVCTRSQLLMVGVAFLATLKTGWSVADRTVPDSGSIIAGSLGDEDITIFCEVFDGGNQQLTTWMRRFPNGTRDVISIDDPNFTFDGEPVPGFPGAIFDTNLTILTLTEDLDRNTIFCGATRVDEEAANFTIRIYLAPSQPTNVDVDQFGITATSVRFCWQLPTNLGMPVVSRYRIVVNPPSFLGESEFITDDRFLNVTDLLPGTTHEFTVYAQSVIENIVAESGPSDTVMATTDTTVPAPDCIGANRSNGILTFSFTHTGGLNLTAVSIDYREQNSQEFQELVNIDLNENILTRDSVDMFNFNLTAGLNYIFRVNASNEEGSMVNECPPLIDLQIGIPQTPDTPTGNSLEQGVIELMLRTVASGVVPGRTIYFDVEVTSVLSNEMFTVMMQFDGYNDSDEVTFRIDGLVGGQEYTFRARARNTLGSSEFSEASNPIEVQSFPHTFGMFQVLLSGVQDCPQWVLLTLVSKLEEVTSIVQTEIEQLCQCGFATRDIAAAAFECSLDPVDQNFVTYRASLQNTQQANIAEILSYLEQWVSESEAITVGGLRLRVNSDCPVVIGSFTDPLCTESQPTPTGSTESTESGNNKSSENTAAIVGGVLGGVVAILTILVGVILIVVLARKLQKSQELDITTKECEAYAMSTTVLGTSTSKITQDTNIAYGAVTSSSQPEEPVYEDV